MSTIIAWQYDADRYCGECTEYKYPGSTHPGDPIAMTDSEGNEILPIFTWDEWHEPSITGCQVLECAGCEFILDVTHDEDCPNIVSPIINEYYNTCIDIEGDVECPYCGYESKYARDGVIECPCKVLMNERLMERGVIG